jgi:hypothetical protein
MIQNTCPEVKTVAPEKQIGPWENLDRQDMMHENELSGGLKVGEEYTLPCF